MKTRPVMRPPIKPLEPQIAALATEVQRRRSKLSGKVGGHLKEFGPLQEFVSFLQHPELATLPEEKVKMLRQIARRFDSAPGATPQGFQTRLETALRRAGNIR